MKWAKHPEHSNLGTGWAGLWESQSTFVVPSHTGVPIPVNPTITAKAITVSTSENSVPGPQIGHVAGTVGTALLSAYPDVTWDGIRYDGHQSWIYVAHNHPSHDGRHLWQWMARQRLEPYRR